MIRVLIVEEEPETRERLADELRREPDLELTGAAAHADEASDLAARHELDVVVCDVPAGDHALDATRAFSGARSPAVVAMTRASGDDLALEAIRAGASGLYAKTEPAGALADAVRGVAAGRAVVAPALLREVVERLPVPDPALEACTSREREVLALVAEGATNPEICEQLVVTDATVRTHVQNLRRKLAARTRAELVSRAFASGLVSMRRAAGRPAGRD